MGEWIDSWNHLGLSEVTLYFLLTSGSLEQNMSSMTELTIRNLYLLVGIPCLSLGYSMVNPMQPGILISIVL
jgi:hypothetical protein